MSDTGFYVLALVVAGAVITATAAVRPLATGAVVHANINRPAIGSNSPTARTHVGKNHADANLDRGWGRGHPAARDAAFNVAAAVTSAFGVQIYAPPRTCPSYVYGRHANYSCGAAGPGRTLRESL